MLGAKCLTLSNCVFRSRIEDQLARMIILVELYPFCWRNVKPVTHTIIVHPSKLMT